MVGGQSAVVASIAHVEEDPREWARVLRGVVEQDCPWGDCDVAVHSMPMWVMVAGGPEDLTLEALNK